jgi:hypothetical protein
VTAPEHEQRELAKTLGLLHKAAGGALKTLSPARLGRAGLWEAPLDAVVLHVLVVRHTEAFCAVARDGVSMLPSAQVLARAVFEVAARGLWLLAPADPFQREARWLALMKE